MVLNLNNGSNSPRDLTIGDFTFFMNTKGPKAMNGLIIFEYCVCVESNWNIIVVPNENPIYPIVSKINNFISFENLEKKFSP